MEWCIIISVAVMHKFVVILEVHTNIAKNFTKILVMSTKSNTNVMGLKTFLDTILLLKRFQFEGILNHKT